MLKSIKGYCSIFCLFLHGVLDYFPTSVEIANFSPTSPSELFLLIGNEILLALLVWYFSLLVFENPLSHLACRLLWLGVH